MTIVEVLISELRRIRKQPGALDAGKLSHARAIVRGLGGGDADEALSRLLLLAGAYEADTEVHAAFATLGLATPSETVLERLDTYAADHYVDQRTVRRWSDAGIEKLANLIVSNAPWMEPRCLLTVTCGAPESGSWRLTVSVKTQGPPHVSMHEPELSVNGEAVELAWGEWQRTDEHISRQSELVSYEVGTDEEATLRVRWRGGREASYALRLTTASPVSAQSRVSLRAFEIRIASSGTASTSTRAQHS